jgi:RNA polymerase sigma-70 factor (TIGR02952 family)
MRSATLRPGTPQGGARAPAAPAGSRPGHLSGAAEDDTAADLKDVVLRARDGDVAAFGMLYDHYVDLIYRYVYNRVGSVPLAEDLTSETFLRALRRIRLYTWQGKDFGAWLVTIARNLVADHFKSGRHRMEVCTAETVEPADAGRHEESPERAVIDAMTNRILLAAVRDLNDDQRRCVVLRFLRGLSVAETALVMDRNVGAIKALQYRAVRALARMLPPDIR